MKALFALMMLASIATGIFAYSAVSTEPSIKILAQSQSQAVNNPSQVNTLGNFYDICTDFNARLMRSDNFNNFVATTNDIKNLAQLIMKSKCIKNEGKNLNTKKNIKFHCMKKNGMWVRPWGGLKAAQIARFNEAMTSHVNAAKNASNQKVHFKQKMQTTSTNGFRCQSYVDLANVILFN